MSDHPNLRRMARDVTGNPLAADPIKERQTLARALLAALDYIETRDALTARDALRRLEELEGGHRTPRRPASPQEDPRPPLHHSNEQWRRGDCD